MRLSKHVFPKICGLFFLLTVGVVNAARPPINCECRDQAGSMRSIGFIQCIEINGGQRLVRCEMSSNTPFWSPLTENGCPPA